MPSTPTAGTVERWARDYVLATDLATKLAPSRVPGMWEVDPPSRRIEAPGRQTTIEFDIEVGDAEEQRVDFALPLGRISGRVLGPTGDPAPRQRVTLTPDAPTRSEC